MSEFDNIEKKLIEVLEQTSKEGLEKKISGDGEWTYRMKELFGNLGEAEGFTICTSGFKDVFNGEWLFDLVWYKEELVEGYKMLADVPLIVESEWKREFKYIKYDFEKLLVSNAERRLFICQSKPDKIDWLMEYFTKAIDTYRLGKKGDRFMIAILEDYYSGEFTYKLITKR